MRETLVFGYAAHAESSASQKKVAAFAALLGRLTGDALRASSARSYDALAKGMRAGDYDVAWLPPIPFVALARSGDAAPLVTHHRAGLAQFHGVIVVRAGSRIRTPLGLRGKRAAWVDPRSASGFVLPRIGLAALGVDPRTAFAEQRFFGSHEAVVRAIVGGAADFAGTYARLDRAGGAVDGPWAALPGAEEAVRVLLTFGKIPGDVTVARRDLDATTRERITRALVGVCHDVEGQMLVREIFGVHEFRRWKAESYEALDRAAARASDEGLLDDAGIARG